MTKKVYVGMSGGVDSSVTAALLRDQGYDVTGVYMKNWSRDLPGVICTWQTDYEDAKRVAVQLNIPFKLYDFETDYRQLIVNYLLNEYQAGRTPNPDIMCNQEMKFKLFLEAALKDGAALIATGHYARLKNGELLTGLDKTKDQSYFLCRMPVSALAQTLMPLGELKKAQVRQLAVDRGLVTAHKPDSQGLCFVGEVGIKDFLRSELGEQSAGAIIDQSGRVIGQHDGAIYYTIGQRHGLNVGGGLAYYVVGKDLSKNEVYVTNDLADPRLWHKALSITDATWFKRPPLSGLKVRLRYRAPLVKLTELSNVAGERWELKLAEEVRALTPGQFAVIYSGDRVIGSGVIS